MDGSISLPGVCLFIHRFGKIINEKGKVSIIKWLIIHFSVAGFSVEFALLNPCGFYFYSFYSIAGYVYPGLGTGEVATNDLFFAIHAFALSSV